MTRILFLAANPNNADTLLAGDELRQIEAALKNSQFEVIAKPAAQLGDLRELLLYYKPQIVHFSGHGSRYGELMFVNDQGESESAPIEALAELFRLFNSQVRCVILNACYSDEQANAIGSQIDCVLGFEGQIRDDAARAFSAGFYSTLASGESIAVAREHGLNEIGLRYPDALLPCHIGGRSDSSSLIPVNWDSPRSAAGSANPEGVKVEGDWVSGDKVGGDKTSVGNIDHSMAVAVGTNATATVNITEEAAYNVQGLINPYLGLRAFNYDDQVIYAGREQLAQETIQRLTAPSTQQTLLFITGASGSGKSSFAQAGLIPLLERHYAAYQKTVRHAIMRPSSQPMVLLVDALQKFHPDLTPETLVVNTPKEQINLLLIDQFEELFIQSDASQRSPFCEFLTNLPSFAECRTHVLITLRVDYLDELFAIENLWALYDQSKVELREMKSDDLRNAIQKPIQVHHPLKRFAPELLDRLVQDAGKDAALLPLLQVTLAELWKTDRLVLSNYHNLTNAIRQRADTVYDFSDYDKADPKIKRSIDEQHALMAILFDLINVSVDGDDRRDARQRRTRYELELGSAQRSKLIEEMVNARLLSAARELRNAETIEVIDIIHESLINNWDRLRQAIEEQRQQLQRRARFKLWLGEWLRSGQQDGALLTDLQLTEAQALEAQHDIELQNPEALEFYTRSRQHIEAIRKRELESQRQLAAEQSRRALIFRNAVIISSLLLVVALGLAEWGRRSSIVALNNAATATIALATSDASVVEVRKERDRANQEAENAATRAAEAKIAQADAEQQSKIAFSRQLAIQSDSQLRSNQYEPAILLAIESGRSADTLEAFSMIRAAIANSFHSHHVLYGHTDEDIKAIWNNDGSKILTGAGSNFSDDKTMRIWSTDTGEELIKFDEGLERIAKAKWSKDETKILFPNGIGDATTGKILTKFEHDTEFIYEATWNHAESKVLTLSGNSGTSSVLIWNAVTGQELVEFNGHTGWLHQAIWNQDDSKILTTSGNQSVTDNDNTARIWDAKTGNELIRFVGHTHPVNQAAWNEDESKILTRSEDGTARIWDATTGKELVKFEDGMSRIDQSFWNQNESKILTQDDSSVRIWDASTGKQLLKLEGDREHFDLVKWSRDESKILALGSFVRIWDAATGKELLKIDTNSGEGVWSHDESKILTISGDTISIWDASTAKELFQLEGHTSPIKFAMWSHDDSKIVTTSEDNTIRIWDITSGEEFIKINAGRAWLTNLSMWNKDESKILGNGFDNSAHIWDAITGKEEITLEGHTRPIVVALWSNDESRILTSDTDTIRIWETGSGKELVSLDAQVDPPQVVWNENESQILTFNNTATLWDTFSGQELFKLEGHKHGITKAIWSKDGDKLLTSSNDATVRIWDTTNGSELAKFTGVHQAIWNTDNSKILTISGDVWQGGDNTARIWDANTGKELVRFEGHAAFVMQAIWSKDESKVLTSGADHTVRIWDAATGEELIRFAASKATWSEDESKILTANGIWDTNTGEKLANLGGFTWATWSQDESKILTISANDLTGRQSIVNGTVRLWDVVDDREVFKLEGVGYPKWSKDESKFLTHNDDGSIRVWYVHMTDLVPAACKWVPRNFIWAEWSQYMADNVGAYRPTCPNAPIPPDAIKGIQEEARQQILAGQVVSGTERLAELNGWLKENYQFDSFGVDVDAFVAEVLATTTTEALPSPTATPAPQAIQTLHPPVQQPASPLVGGLVSPLALPTISRP